MQQFLEFELWFLNFLGQCFSGSIMDNLMIFTSWLGNSGAIWIIFGLLLLIKPQTRTYGWLVLLSLLGCFVIGNLALKPLVARLRPFAFTSVNLLIPAPQDFSFPSGHTMSSFAAAVGIYAWNKKYGTLAYVFAGLIAFSRMYLFVHFPTDILGGIIIGLAIGFLVKKRMKVL